MNSVLNTRPTVGNQGARTLKLFAVGTLVVGGLSGVLLKRTAADRLNGRPEPEGRVVMASREPVMAPVLPRMDGAQPVAGTPAGGAYWLRRVDVTPPDDPFRPLQGEEPAEAPVAAPVPAPVSPAPPAVTKPVKKATPAPAAKPAAKKVSKPAPAVRPGRAGAGASPAVAAPRPEELVVTGVVQGEPPLAVVRFADQLLFLKIGDRVADTWRLVEIRERSAVFQLGARQVEIPIKGDSSE
jgi:hypothetical protein